MGHLVGNLGLPWLFHSLLMEIFQRFHILQRIADSAAKCPTLRLQYHVPLFHSYTLYTAPPWLYAFVESQFVTATSSFRVRSSFESEVA